MSATTIPFLINTSLQRGVRPARACFNCFNSFPVWPYSNLQLETDVIENVGLFWVRQSGIGLPHSTTSRRVARSNTRQRLGVQPYAAFAKLPELPHRFNRTPLATFNFQPLIKFYVAQ